MGRGSSRRRSKRGGGDAAGDARPSAAGEAAADADPREDQEEGDGSRLSRLHLWQVQIVRDLLLVGLLILLVWIGYALRAVTVPLLMALLLAYLFEPVVARITRSPRFSREGAVVAILSTLLAAVVILGGLLIPLVVHQTSQLVSFVRSERVERAAEDLIASAPSTPGELLDHVRTFLLGDGEDDGEAGDDTEGDADASADGADAGAAPPADEGGPSDDGADATADADADPDPDAAADAEADPAGGGEVDGLAPDRLAALDELLQARGLAPLTEAERRRLAATREQDEDVSEMVAVMRRLLEERGPPVIVTAPTVAGDRTTFDFVGIARNSLDRFTAMLGVVLQFGLVAFLIPFYFYFFSVSWPRIIEFGASLVPDRHRDRTFELVGRMDTVVAGFVRGRIVISVIMGVLFAIGWWICGVPYAIPVGLMVGIFSAVPYLGGVGIPIAVGLLVFEQLTQPGGRDMPWWLIIGGPVGVFALVQLLEGYVLTPVIAGKATNLDPVTILVAVLAGGSILGVYGMLLAIPAAACAKILLSEMVMPKIDAWKRGERADPLPLDG